MNIELLDSKRDSLKIEVGDVEGIYCILIIEIDYDPAQRGSAKHFIEPLDSSFSVESVSIKMTDENSRLSDIALFKEELQAEDFDGKVLEFIEGLD